MKQSQYLAASINRSRVFEFQCRRYPIGDYSGDSGLGDMMGILLILIELTFGVLSVR